VSPEVIGLFSPANSAVSERETSPGTDGNGAPPKEGGAALGVCAAAEAASPTTSAAAQSRRSIIWASLDGRLGLRHRLARDEVGGGGDEVVEG
jgi:hypothetical protein